MKKSPKVATFLASAFIIGACLQSAWAQGEKPYPIKQITYLVCYAPGGQGDRLARIQQPYLEKILGQKVLIDYKIGGGGALGWRDMIAQTDGYLMAGINLPAIIIGPLQQDVGYTTEQIAPVCMFELAPMGLAVLNTSPIKSVKEYLENAKKNPGTVTVTGAGLFGAHQMATLRLAKLSGIQLTYVPFDGGAPAVTAFLGGHVSSFFGALDDITRFRSKVRVLAFATEKRMADFPDTPTLKELGYDMTEANERGVGVSAKTPEYIIKKLEAAFMQIAGNPEVHAAMKKQHLVPEAVGYKQNMANITKSTPMYKELMVGLK